VNLRRRRSWSPYRISARGHGRGRLPKWKAVRDYPRRAPRQGRHRPDGGAVTRTVFRRRTGDLTEDLCQHHHPPRGLRNARRARRGTRHSACSANGDRPSPRYPTCGARCEWHQATEMKIGSRLAETRPQSSRRLVYCSYARRHELHIRHALDGRCGVSSLPALLLT